MLCLLLSDKVIPDVMTGDICFLILIFMSYVFLAINVIFFCIYFAAAIGKIKAKKKFSRLGLNELQPLSLKMNQ